jgi:hypothetical protein
MIWYKDNKKAPPISKQWTMPAFLPGNGKPESNKRPSFYETATVNESSDQRSRGKLLLERWRSIRSFHLLWLLVAPGSLLFLLLGIVLIEQGFGPVALWLFLPPAISWLPLAVLSYATRYRIYENRIDILTGIFSHRQESIWLYQISDAIFIQSPLDWITNTATIWVTFEADGNELGIRQLPLIGLGNIRFMQEFRDELCDITTQQRHDLKGWFM